MKRNSNYALCTIDIWVCSANAYSVNTELIRTSTGIRLHLKCDGTRAETRFGLSAKRASPFKSAGASVQSTTGSRAVRMRGSNAGYTVFRGSVRVLATHSIRQFPLHFPSRASRCAITFQLDSTTCYLQPPSLRGKGSNIMRIVRISSLTFRCLKI